MNVDARFAPRDLLDRPADVWVNVAHDVELEAQVRPAGTQSGECVSGLDLVLPGFDATQRGKSNRFSQRLGRRRHAWHSSHLVR